MADSGVDSGVIVPVQAMGLEYLKCASVFSAKCSGAQLFTKKGEQGEGVFAVKKFADHHVIFSAVNSDRRTVPGVFLRGNR